MNPLPSLPTRRQLLYTTLAAGIGTSLGPITSSARAQPPLPADLPTMLPKIKDIRQRLGQQVQHWLAAGNLSRSDGFTYTIDIANFSSTLPRPTSANIISPCAIKP